MPESQCCSCVGQIKSHNSLCSIAVTIHVRADHRTEVIWLVPDWLQILLFLLLSTASLIFIPCAVSSSFTLSIHFFGCLPLLLVPSTCPYSATAGSLFPFILVTCPNHVSLLFLILSISVISYFSSFLVTSFRIMSLLDLPSILRSHLI